ncbi:MAG: UDP-N-acetylglucosamine 1-carboxyvinyltransferase, partial [Oscillospiraceae bacterium]
MDKYLIEGERTLRGQIKVQGAKNAVLPILAAAVLCDETVIENAPDLSDVDAACNILKSLGCTVKRDGDTISVDTRGITSFSLEDSLAREMRSSIIFLGALTARFGAAQMCYPGGCELGSRPVDLHIEALRAMGAEIEEIHGRLTARVNHGLHGAAITLPFPSVGATENAILAAALAEGETIIYNAAREPEIADLALFLNNCGAKICIKQNTIHIEGVKKLHGCRHRIIPDRIEAVTFLAATAATGGEIRLTDCIPTHFQAVISVFNEMGCEIKTDKSSMWMKSPQKLNGVSTIKTMPY